MATSLTSFVPLDLEGQTDYVDKSAPKVIYAGNVPAGDTDTGTGQPYLYVAEDYISIVGDETKVFTVSPTYGANLSGPLSFAAMPDQISIGGGYWRINPLVLSTLASTTVTPIPWLVKATPRLLQSTDSLTSGLNYAESGLGIT